MFLILDIILKEGCENVSLYMTDVSTFYQNNELPIPRVALRNFRCWTTGPLTGKNYWTCSTFSGPVFFFFLVTEII
jgi:hypothetical protein